MGITMNKDQCRFESITSGNLKVLFVGLGGIGQRHLRNLLALFPAAEVYAIRRRGYETVLTEGLKIFEGDTLKEKYNLHYVSNMEDAVSKGVRIVFICNPTSLHSDSIAEAMGYGFHIFVEKPLSHDIKSASLISEKLKDYKAVNMVGYQNRFHPYIRKAKDAVENELIGRTVFVDAWVGEDVRGWHTYEDYRKLYACRDDMGGGVILTQIHEIDYLYYIFGMPKAVFAMGGKQSNLEINVEDVAEISMQYSTSDGVTFTIHIHEDYIQNPPSRGCKIAGTKGMIEFDLIHSKYYRYDENGTCVESMDEAVNRNHLFLDELMDFMTAVFSNGNSSIPMIEGVYGMIITSAVKESMIKEEMVEISRIN